MLDLIYPARKQYLHKKLLFVIDVPYSEVTFDTQIYLGEKMKKQTIYRIILYLIALLILALGLTLNTKAGLGVSPIISVSYCVSIISGHNFGNTTLALYTLFVFLELILHTYREHQYAKRADKALAHANKVNLRLIYLMDLLQIPFSIVFTRFLNIFSNMLPDLPDGDMSPKMLVIRFALLLIALICTGIGAAMSLDMKIIPNPGDGIVQAIADCINKSVGFTKNCVDVVNLLITVTISLVFSGELHGVGVGTVFAVILVGRIIALFNHLAKEKLTKLAGITE